MQPRIPMHGAFFLCANYAASVVGLDPRCIWAWAKRKTTSYDFPLRVVEQGGHIYIAEADVRVAERVQREFPLLRGRIKHQRREEMKAYALRLRTLNPGPESR
jgi:hypothetical protein